MAEETMNLMLISGEYSRLHAAAMLSAVASSYGKTVNIFVSMEALPAFHRDPQISEASLIKGPVAKKIGETGGQNFIELFQQAKDFGEVTIYACGLVMDVYHWTLADLNPIFDEVMGVAGFLAKAEGQPTFTF
jgi:peroxiredoxin family protein